MEQIVLSILIPTYNRCTELKLLLDQLNDYCKAYNTNLEILISNNNAEDSTREVLDKLTSNSNNFPFRVFNQKENIGPSANFRFLVTQAKGKFTWIIPDDDYLAENKFSELIELLKSYPYDILSVRTQGIIDCEAIKKRSEDNIITVSAGEEDYGDLAFGATFCSSCIYRTTLFREKFKEAEEYDEGCYPHWYCYLGMVELKRKLMFYNQTVVLGNRNMIGPSQLSSTFVLILGRLNAWNVFRKTAAGKAIKMRVMKIVFIHWAVIVLGRANDINNFGQVKQFIERVVTVYRLGKLIKVVAVGISYVIYLPQIIKQKRMASSSNAINAK